MMHAFLRIGGSHNDTGLLKAYVEQIRDLAYDIEDCLEEFMVFIKHRSLRRQLLSLGDRHRIAIQIRTIKQRVQDMSQRSLRYNLIKLTPTNSNNDDMTRQIELTQHFLTLYVEEAQLVGLEGPKNKLKELMTNKVEDPKLKVILVVGMGGLGKTTLAKKVYDSKELGLSGQFDCRAWITVSQSFNIKEILKDMIEQLFGTESLGKVLQQYRSTMVQEEHLINHIKNNLQERRYFVILNDLWTEQAWDCIKLAFPDNTKEGSCVIVTTRNGDLAKSCSPSSLIYKLKRLKRDDATQLLLRKINKSLDDLEKHSSMKGLVEKILKKCGGLPLAIVTIGGLLANKDVKKWERLYQQLPSELENNPSLEALRRVVTLSYNHLPSHLKVCFLYLSIFPEDFEINQTRLLNRWIAEGFIRSEATEKTIEAVVDNYFYELISRSMIQPSKLDIDGKVESCRVHDIARDIAASIARQENLVFFIEKHSTSATEENIRHLTCFASKKLTVGLDLSRVRSLTLFNEPVEPLSLYLSQLKMLRVLDLENATFCVKQKDLSNLGLLCHLKYLSVPSGSYIYALPRSIGNLQGLQTLRMRYTYIVTLPTEITKLRNLRNLNCSKSLSLPDFAGSCLSPSKCVHGFCERDDINECWTCSGVTACLPFFLWKSFGDPEERARLSAAWHVSTSRRGWSRTDGVGVPKGIGSLKELQVLELVDIEVTSSKAVQELGELTQLRELRVEASKKLSDKKIKNFSEAFGKLSSLRSLSMTVTRLDWLNSISYPPPPLLQELRLTGHLGEMPEWVGKLENLVEISLWFSKLKEGEALTRLEKHPNLISLSLYGNAYIGEKLVFRGGAFPKLRILCLSYMDDLREVTFEEGTSPMMESISIDYCRLSGICGTNHLPRLKEISLGYDAKVANLDALQREVDAHPNHPLLTMWGGTREDHDLGCIEVTKVTEQSKPDCIILDDNPPPTSSASSNPSAT